MLMRLSSTPVGFAETVPVALLTVRERPAIQAAGVPTNFVVGAVFYYEDSPMTLRYQNHNLPEPRDS
jgi:hypothetical protein